MIAFVAVVAAIAFAWKVVAIAGSRRRFLPGDSFAAVAIIITARDEAGAALRVRAVADLRETRIAQRARAGKLWKRTQKGRVSPW